MLQSSKKVGVECGTKCDFVTGVPRPKYFLQINDTKVTLTDISIPSFHHYYFKTCIIFNLKLVFFMKTKRRRSGVFSSSFLRLWANSQNSSYGQLH